MTAIANLGDFKGLEPFFRIIEQGLSGLVDTARGASRLVAVVVGAITSGRDADVRRAVAGLHGSGVAAAALMVGSGIAGEEDIRRLGADGWTGHDAQRALVAIESAIES